MKTEDLINAFGQIDDEIFAETEKELAGCFEEQGEAVMISAATKKTIRPYLVGAAVLALIIALPLLVTHFANNTPADIEPSYTLGESVTGKVDGTAGTEPVEAVGENEEKTGGESSLREMSIEEIIAESDCILRAKFIGAEFISSEDSGDYYNCAFSKIETIKDTTGGAFGDNFELGMYADYRQIFTEGEYIIPLHYIDSVYFDSPYCNITGGTVISCDDGIIKSVSVGGSAAEIPEGLTTVDDFTRYANSIEDRSSSLSGGYITSTSLNDIIEQSDYIVKAVIDHEPFRSGENRGMYTCNLVQCYKGEVEETFEAVFMYDSVEVGKEYYFFLTKSRPTSTFYIVSSKNSIYSSDDTNVADMINLLSADNSTVYINGAEYTLIGEPVSADKLSDYNIENIITADDYFGKWEDVYRYAEEFFDGMDFSYKSELKKLFWNAYVLALNGENGDGILWNSVIKTPRPAARLEGLYYTYFETGFRYDSFYNSYTDIFTGKTTEVIFAFSPWFLSYNGELWIAETVEEGYSKLLPYEEEYEIVNQTDTEVTIRRTLYFYDWLSAGEEYRFDPAKKELYTKQYSDCKFVLTNEGWRVEDFMIPPLTSFVEKR